MIRRNVIAAAGTMLAAIGLAFAALVSMGPWIGPPEAPVRAEPKAILALTPSPPRIGLPALGLDAADAPAIHFQNIGDAPIVALSVFWGETLCPPQASGPLKLECTGLVRPGGAWISSGPMLPADARSAIVYSLNATDMVVDPRGNSVKFSDLACSSLFAVMVGNHEEWAKFDKAYQAGELYEAPGLLSARLDFGAHPGDPLAVRVDRDRPGGDGQGRTLRASYTGFGTDRIGVPDPIWASYGYAIPWITLNAGDVTSRLQVQNLGAECALVEFWFRPADSRHMSSDDPPDNCGSALGLPNLSLAPGASAPLDTSAWIGTTQGGGLIRSNQPVAIVVDALGPHQFASANALPAALFNMREPNAAVGELDSLVNVAPLIYRGYRGTVAAVQGWDTRLFVQNTSTVLAAKLKLAFQDRGGETVLTLNDWLCPRGNQVFDLREVGGLPDNWVGSIRIESQVWWTPSPAQAFPPELYTMVELAERPAAGDAPADLAAYTALTRHGGTEADDSALSSDAAGATAFGGAAVLALPGLAKGRSEAVPSTQLALVNLVEQPGYTDYAMFLFDQNGLLDFMCEKLGAGDVAFIDLPQWGVLPPGFKGSAIASATWWEHDVFSATGLFLRNPVGLGAVLFNRVTPSQGGTTAAPSEAIEAIPLAEAYQPVLAAPCFSPPIVPSPTPTMPPPTATPERSGWVVHLPWADTGLR